MPRKKSARTRLDDARAQMYRDLLFESAEAVFGAKGYVGATMQDIASEAGVSLKTLYATFPGKQELFEEVMRVRAAEFAEETRTAMRGIEDPIERIEQGITSYVRFLLDHRDWLQIHLRAPTAWRAAPDGPEVATEWREGLEGYARMIHEAQELGRICEGDPEELAVLTQSVMQVQMARADDQGIDEPDDVVAMILRPVWRLLGVAERLEADVELGAVGR